MKSQKYTQNEIFEKTLLLLIPFYFFSHETQFEKYETDNTELQALREEYDHIKRKLEELLKKGTISVYKTYHHRHDKQSIGTHRHKV